MVIWNTVDYLLRLFRILLTIFCGYFDYLLWLFRALLTIFCGYVEHCGLSFVVIQNTWLDCHERQTFDSHPPSSSCECFGGCYWQLSQLTQASRPLILAQTCNAQYCFQSCDVILDTPTEKHDSFVLKQNLTRGDSCITERKRDRQTDGQTGRQTETERHRERERITTVQACPV